jgi:capsular exopolysaccharide synthesis family protein
MDVSPRPVADERSSPVAVVRVRPDAPLVLHLDPPSFAAEQYRSLAVQLEDRIEDSASGTGYLLAVTSAEEQAGKTLTSLNLALTLARGGEHRVLLVETDLWRPGLRPYFESWPRDRGLVQVLERQLPLAQAIVEVASAGLHVLPAGSSTRPGDVLSGRRVAELFDEVRRRYEIVVRDTPPLPLLASARAVAGRADGVVLVVRAGQSRRSGIEHAVRALGPQKVIGLLLNGARVRYQSYY